MGSFKTLYLQYNYQYAKIMQRIQAFLKYSGHNPWEEGCRKTVATHMDIVSEATSNAVRMLTETAIFS